MYSFTFNGVDMSGYGLIVSEVKLPISQVEAMIQLPERAYAYYSSKQPKVITITAEVIASSHSVLLTCLDAIKMALNNNGDRKLLIDSYSGRFWYARFTDWSDEMIKAGSWRGQIIFTCYDPMAYGTTLISTDHSIDASPKTVIETPGGSGIVHPIYIFAAKETYTAITISNDTTGESLAWSGSIATNQELIIDTVFWTVKVNNTTSMAIFGNFPRLVPSEANALRIIGAWDSGHDPTTLTIKYRNRFI